MHAREPPAGGTARARPPEGCHAWGALPVLRMMRKSPARLLVSGLFLLAAGLLIAAFHYAPRLIDYMRVDYCLDAGGCWDEVDDVCRKEEDNAQQLCDRPLRKAGAANLSPGAPRAPVFHLSAPPSALSARFSPPPGPPAPRRLRMLSTSIRHTTRTAK